MDPIIHFLREGKLPENKAEARKIHIRATLFVIIDEVLYRRAHSLPYLCCANSKEANYVLREVHEGIYGNHAGERSLVGKALKPIITSQRCRKTPIALSTPVTGVNVLPTSRHNRENQ